jgi:hypothetical protein
MMESASMLSDAEDEDDVEDGVEVLAGSDMLRM